MSRELPIIFSTVMVQAKPGVAKTNTRRLINRLKGHKRIYNFGKSVTPGYDWHFRDSKMRWHDLTHDQLMAIAPYQKGDLLYVREAWRGIEQDYGPNRIEYKASETIAKWGKWRPSIHMPKDAARIWLRVVDLRPEQLQDISEQDAVAEGVKLHEGGLKWLNYEDEKGGLTQFIYNCHTAKRSFESLWAVIHGRQSWRDNPWVWRIEIKRVDR